MPAEERASLASRFVYVASFFIVIATVLGTGILGLPVKLDRCGFAPFVVTYTICFFMQVCVIWYTVELLQRAQAIQYFGHPDSLSLTSDEAIIPLTELQSSSENANEQERTLQRSPTSNTFLSAGPDLHLVGRLFLGPINRRIFDGAILLHFVSILISYALAGSEAYGKLIGIPYTWLIAPFVIIFTLFLIFGAHLLEAIVSVLTGAKGSLLVFMVFVTAIVAMQSDRTIHDNWVFIGRPLLIGTVALGGAPNTLPVMFGKVGFRKTEQRKFLVACIAGLAVVFVLNVVWCYYVLKLVPQSGSVSLRQAGKDSQIAIVPLMSIIDEHYPQFKWIATLVDAFMMVSITVSYVTVGTGLRHILDGFVKIDWCAVPRSNGAKLLSEGSFAVPVGNLRTVKERAAQAIDRIRNALHKLEPRRVAVRQALLYTLFYTTVLAVALANPKSFFVLLENVSSLALNLQAGLLLCHMLGTSRLYRQDFKVPFPVPPIVFKARFVVMLYFLFAIFYDLALIVNKAVETLY